MSLIKVYLSVLVFLTLARGTTSAQHPAQKTAGTKATATGECAVSHIGNNDTIIIEHCGLSEQQGKQIANMLKEILSKQIELPQLQKAIDGLGKDQSRLLTYGSPVKGELLPGKKPDPALPYRCEVPDGALRVFIGDSVAYSEFPEVSAFTTGMNNYVTIERTQNGVAVSARSTDLSGKILAIVEKNKFKRNPSNTLDGEVSDDNTTLTVTDDHGDIALSVEYLNKNTVRVKGLFATRQGIIDIQDQQIVFHNNQHKSTFSRMCSGSPITGIQFP